MNSTKNNQNLESLLLNNLEKKFAERLLKLQKEQFSGYLKIEANAKLQWKIYFCLGRLIWAEGGEHPHRAWRRNLLKYSHNVNIDYSILDNQLHWDSIKYQILSIYLERKLITREAALNFINYQIANRLFDLFQFKVKGDLAYTEIHRATQESLYAMLKKPIALINTQQAINKSQKDFSTWLENGLVFWSPNLAPKIIKPEALAEIVPANTYNSLTKILDGKKSLRDLACLMQQDTIRLTVNLAPYVYQGILEFSEVEDVRSLIKKIEVATHKQQEKKRHNGTHQPLIVSVDDRPEFTSIVGKVIERAGYRFLPISDNLNAVATIVKSNPDLILLDVDMPVVNGYEICTALRRVPQLKKTPIIMLTGHSDLVSKIKAKMLGANDFLSKPTNYRDLINTVQEFL